MSNEKPITNVRRTNPEGRAASNSRNFLPPPSPRKNPPQPEGKPTNGGK